MTILPGWFKSSLVANVVGSIPAGVGYSFVAVPRNKNLYVVG